MKSYYEEKVETNAIIEELVITGLKKKLHELAWKMIKVQNTEELKALIEELKGVQEAVSDMIKSHDYARDDLARDKKEKEAKAKGEAGNGI